MRVNAQLIDAIKDRFMALPGLQHSLHRAPVLVSLLLPESLQLTTCTVDNMTVTSKGHNT